MTIEEINEMNKIVKKSNLLARASWSPDSIWESRLVAIVAAQVHQDDTDFKMYSVPITALLKEADITRTGRVYNALDKLTDKAMTRLIKIKEGRSWKKYTLFSKCEYTEGSGELLLQFHPDLRVHYLELKKHFTTYSLSEYLSLPSVYSQRIYEILRSWDDCVSTEISVSDLHEKLCTPPSLRKNFKDLRRRVLEKAYKDIHKYTKLQYEYEAIKKGKKVVKIRFFFGKKSKQKAKLKQIQNDNKKQQKKDNKLFLEAVECAKVNKDKNGFCVFRGTKKYCSACF